MNINRRKLVYRVLRRGIAVMLSALMLVSMLSFDTTIRVLAEEIEPLFVFTDKHGAGICGIVVTLAGTDGELVVSEPSDNNGIVKFVNNVPVVGNSYTYTVDTGQYIPVENDDSIIIADENFPVEIILYAPAPTGEITPDRSELSFGDTVTLCVGAAGIGQLSYQWYKDDMKLDDKNSSSLTIDPVLLTDMGTYCCEVMSDASDEDIKLTLVSTLSVSKAEPEISVSANPVSGSSYAEDGITLSATVSHPLNSMVAKPVGNVEFFVDGVPRGIAVLDDGMAMLPSVVLTSGASHSIYAKYLSENDANYSDATSETIPYVVDKISPVEGVDYIKNTPNGDNGWYKIGGFLEIKPSGSFDQIREGEGGEWKNELTKSEETAVSGNDVIFYLGNSVTGEISNPQTVNYMLDKTQPDNENASPKWISDGRGEEWEKEYLGDIGGGGRKNIDNYLYHMILTARDTLSGSAFFQWKYGNSNDWSEWITAANGMAQIDVKYKLWRNGIDIRVRDGAGNISDKSAVPEQNVLAVEYSMENFQRYVNHKNEEVAEDKLDDSTRLIYNKAVTVALTATADNFNASEVVVSINDEPVAVEWELEGSDYIGTFELSEGDSVVEVSAEGYAILSNEAGNKIVNEKYVSNIHTVDTEKPVLEVIFEPETEQLREDRKMEVTITDKNFSPSQFDFSVFNVQDIQGNAVSELKVNNVLNDLKDASWKTEGDVHSAIITFSTEGIYNFTLEFKDLANNTAAPYEAEQFVIDKTAPDNLQIVYDTTPVSAFLQVITFGFYNPSVTVQIYADDSITGVECFNLTYLQEEGSSTTKNVAFESFQIDNTDSEHFAYTNKGKTAVGTCTLTANEIKQYRGSISFTATDMAGQTSNIHYGDGMAKDENGNVYQTGRNHVVVVDTIAPIREVTYLEPQLIRERDTLTVFTGDCADYVNQEGTNSIIYYDNTYGGTIPVTLKVNEANFYEEDVLVKVNDTAYEIDDWLQNEDEWTGTIKLTDDGEYVITVDYTDRSGNKMQPYQSEKIVIDRVKPVISKYEFAPADSDGNTDTTEFIDVLEYGFYFKTDFKAEIHTSDASPSSGLDKIAYRLVPYEGGTKQDEIVGILPVVNGKVNLSVPAGFKGQIFAESYDNAGNKSDEVTPKAFVVDNNAPTIDIIDNNVTFYKDAAGNPLYGDDISITVTITDMVSGIKEIGYMQSSEKAAIPRKNIILDNTGYNVGDNLADGWIVSAMDQNLVTKVTKIFSYNSDDNDIIFTIDAMDRCGNKKEGVSSNIFTIDKTDPIINIVFREDDDTDLYYDSNRIADITVIERNFDSSCIKTNIENKFGNIPNVTFEEISKTEHTAVINFDEGDYTFEMSGTDLGGRTAAVNYSGGNERLFYVDKTRPVVTENFVEFSNSATENSFNEDKTVSISITEHNFSSDLVKLNILWKDAGSSHNAAGLADGTAAFISSADWVTNGDVHTITFTVNTDAVYQIEMEPADLAGNTAERRNTVIFEIDKTAPVVSARNGGFVGADEVRFLDVYTYDRKDEAAPTIEFTDLNIDHIKYDLNVWIPDYTNAEAWPIVKPQKIYLLDDADQTGIIRGGKFVLPDFTKDGVYALELIAVDVAGNESRINTNTYARLIEQDVLAFILNSNVERKTGLYSFQYEDGVPMSMRPDNFRDLNIFVFARKNTNVDIVLRDTNADEIYANAQVTTDNSIYGFTIYNFVLKSDFFKDNFSSDTDADLHLTVKNDDKRIDLGRIHIDNVAPTCKLPEGFTSWHWYFGEETRTIVISDINELLDENNCKVYDNGKEMDFVCSNVDNTITFTLEKGWHNVGIVLRDMAGNENNIQEKVNMHVGYFWVWAILTVTGFIICAGVLILRISSRKKRMLENE